MQNLVNEFRHFRIIIYNQYKRSIRWKNIRWWIRYPYRSCLLLIHNRQSQGYRSTNILLWHQPNIATMQFRIGFHQIKSDSSSLIFSRSLGWLEETLENIRLVLNWYSGTGICHRNIHLPPTFGSIQRKSNGSAFRRIFYSIGKQIIQNRLQLDGIHLNV